VLEEAPDAQARRTLRTSATRRLERAMFSVVGVRASLREPDRRAVLRLAHDLSESTLLYRKFKEKPQQTEVSRERRRAMEWTDPKE